MERTALFFDIDGTLLSEFTGSIPKSAADAVTRAKELGHLTFVNTGRTACSIPQELKKLPFGGYICGCGTSISYGDELLLSGTIPANRRKELIWWMHQCKVDPILEGQEDCYFSSRRSRFEQVESTRRYFREMGIGVERYLDKEDVAFDKFVFYADEQSDQERLFEELQKDMEIMDRKNGFFEVVPKMYSKATAIEYVLEHFQIPKERAYVFGDSSNDLTMFQCVPHAIAMEVHDPILDPYTEFVTKKVEEDGIAYALEHFVGISLHR